jgi:thioredoxin 1
MNTNGRINLKSVLLIVCFLFVGAALAGVVYSQKAAPKSDKAASKPTPAAQGLPRLVDVGADKCVPCIMMAPFLEQMKKEYQGILQVDFVDAWKNPDEAQKYRVRGIPTQIFYDASGKELGRHLGFISKEDILKGFEQVGITIKKPQNK